jgi:hypothetical protein
MQQRPPPAADRSLESSQTESSRHRWSRRVSDTSCPGVVHYGSHRLSWALDSVQEARSRCCRTNALEGDDSPLIPLSVHVWHLTEGLACLSSCQSSTIPASRAPTATIRPVSMEPGTGPGMQVARLGWATWFAPCSPAFSSSFALTV